MRKVSLEYCHFYPGRDEERQLEIERSNYGLPRMLAFLADDDKVQKCIMVDDIHHDVVADDQSVQALVDDLAVKPDCVYLESAFIKPAQQVLDALESKGLDIIQEDEKVFLREHSDRFHTTTEFILSWRDKHGQAQFSCPVLAATSYLVRLGHLQADLKPVYGEKLMIADRVLNLLSSTYLPVENEVQSIIRAVCDEASPKIAWFFY